MSSGRVFVFPLVGCFPALGSSGGDSLCSLLGVATRPSPLDNTVGRVIDGFERSVAYLAPPFAFFRSSWGRGDGFSRFWRSPCPTASRGIPQPPPTPPRPEVQGELLSFCLPCSCAIPVALVSGFRSAVPTPCGAVCLSSSLSGRLSNFLLALSDCILAPDSVPAVSNTTDGIDGVDAGPGGLEVRGLLPDRRSGNDRSSEVLGFARSLPVGFPPEALSSLRSFMNDNPVMDASLGLGTIV